VKTFQSVNISNAARLFCPSAPGRSNHQPFNRSMNAKPNECASRCQCTSTIHKN
jgi:hypothetical protein